MEMAKSPGFIKISSVAHRKIVWYYAKNLVNYQVYHEFLWSLVSELENLLKTRVQRNLIKFNLKLEATYSRPHVANSSENIVFKTSAVEIFIECNVTEILERAYMKLMTEAEEYKLRGSGFTMETIDGLLLAIYKYTPMGGSSYIQLPKFIDMKRATIN